MITKVSQVKHLVVRGLVNFEQALPEIKQLAQSEDWKEREVAATILVEISKKNAARVIAEASLWADDPDPNIRRAASEGLRHLSRRNPEQVLPVLEKLKQDADLYVKKSVANVLDLLRQ